MRTSRIARTAAAATLLAMVTFSPGVPKASVLDTPIFNVLGLVIVWGADATATTAPVVGDFVLMLNPGAAGTDLIAADVRPVVTGSLQPIQTAVTATEGELMSLSNATPANGNFTDNGTVGMLDAADTFDAFDLTTATDITTAAASQSHSFYVASNTAFDISATAAVNTASGDFAALGLADITLDMAVNVSGNDGIAYGANAQDPGTGAGNPVTGTGLDTLAGTLVFQGTQRTAAAPGTITEQSVRFDSQYTLDIGGSSYDLSDGVGTLAADVTYTIFVP